MDSLASSRDSPSGIHEASRRILSVILQRLDGFSGESRNLLICATNRKQDLDAALLSRFDLSIHYNLPDMNTRAAVFSRYAKHLSNEHLQTLAKESSSLSCRDIKDVCEQAERQTASSIVKKELSQKNATPDLNSYLNCIQKRKNAANGYKKSYVDI